MILFYFVSCWLLWWAALHVGHVLVRFIVLHYAGVRVFLIAAAHGEGVVVESTVILALRVGLCLVIWDA